MLTERQSSNLSKHMKSKHPGYDRKGSINKSSPFTPRVKEEERS